MTEQEITIQLSDDPFDTKTVNVKLPDGVKLLSSESYAIEMLKDYGINIDDQTCDQAYDDISIKNGSIVKGIIYSVNDDYALVNVGSKFTASCYTNKEPKEIVDQLKPNLMVDVKIKTNPNGEIIASISDALAEVRKAEILESIGDKSVGFKCKVKELIQGGGYWVDITGIQCFMPGSLGGINKLYDFESLIGKELIVMPITYSREKNTIVVSHREYLKTLIPSTVDELRLNTNDPIIGKVTGTTNFGVFAEFNKCLTGLIPKDELADSLKSFNSNSIKPGDQIKFWVKDIINQNKIILTQHGAVENPWVGAGKKYPPMSTAVGKVTKKTKYGVFVQLEKGISGLLHKSETGDKTFNKGDSVKVLIKSVNPSDQRISMSLS